MSLQKKEDDASSVGSHSDSCPEEFESDEDIVYWPSSDTLQLQGGDPSVGSLIDKDVFKDSVVFPTWEPVYCKALINEDKDEEVSQETVDKLRKLMGFIPAESEDGEMHYCYIYGYYRRRRAYGGYGIVMLNNSREPIGAYCGASKGGSHLYHLLVGMKRGLQIASKWGLTRVMWVMNSYTAVHYFNHIFMRPCRLRNVFHSLSDAANGNNFCLACMRKEMMLTAASFEVLVPVINGIIKLQYSTKFKYSREGCATIFNEAAYYVAQCGAEALEKRMKLRERGVGELNGDVYNVGHTFEQMRVKMTLLPGWNWKREIEMKMKLAKYCIARALEELALASAAVQEQEIVMKMCHPEKLTPIVKREKKSLETEWWNVLQRGQRPWQANGPLRHEIPYELLSLDNLVDEIANVPVIH